jgi:hypothetical protein
MAFVYMGLIFFGFIAAMALIKFLNLGSGLTAAIIFPLFLFVIFCLAWVQPKDSKSEKGSPQNSDLIVR